MWDSIKQAFNSFIEYLGEGGQYLVTAILLIVLAVASIFIIQNWVGPEISEDKNEEVALNPSIGEALSPDVNIDVVTSPNGADATIVPKQEDSGNVSGEITYFVAPATGIDDSKPIPYYNNELGFKLTLPPKATVKEKGDTVYFYSEAGKHLATVSVQSSTDSLEQIKAQLNLSPDVSNLASSEIAKLPALKFNQKNAAGFALKNQNRVYYLNGEENLITKINL